MILPDTDEFTSRFPDEIRTLLTMLRMGNLGGLAVAESDDLDLRVRLFDYFRRRLEANSVYLFNYEVSGKDTNLVRSLTELTEHPRFKNLELTGKYKSIAIFVYGLEKFTPDQRDQFVKLINFLRDRLTMIAYPVVIWGTSAFVTQLARNAPDFWSWKGYFFSFPSTGPLADTGDSALLTSPSLAAEASPVRRYLRRIIEDPDYRVWKELYVPLKAVRADETISAFPPRHTLTYKELRRLAPLLPHAETFEPNHIIFKRGDQGDSCHIIVSGEVEVLVPDALGNDIVVSRLGKGDFFGEISLIKQVPRTATVRTARPTKLVTLTRGSLRQLKQKSPDILELLADIAQRRLEARTQDPQEIVSPLRRFALEGSSLARENPIDVRELVANDRRAVILGEAGAGKTTVLRRMMLDIAESTLRALNAGKEAVVLPVFIKLNALSPAKTIEQTLLELFRGYEIPKLDTGADLNALLSGQGPDDTPIQAIVFLMDGLNELPAQNETRQELNRFIQQYNQHRFVFSCRAQDYTALQGFRTAMLQRLSGEDIEAFLVNYLHAEQGRNVAREIYSDPQLEDLAQTPLALFMLAQIAKRSDEELPKNRGVLFEVFTDNLLERTDTEWQKVLTPYKSQSPLKLRKQILAALGLAMQEEEAWTFALDRWLEIIAAEVRLYQKQATPSERVELELLTPHDIHHEIMRSGLVRYAESRSWVEFAHHTYQEFYAALAQLEKGYDLEPRLGTNEARRRWQDTIVLLYGINKDKPALFSKILGADNDYARIWLAAQCLANSGQDIAAAVQLFERTLPMTQHFALLFSAGLASRQLGRYPEALSYLTLASEEAPGSAEAEYELGALYRKVEQYGRAIEHLEEAIRLRSDFVDAYNQLGITYHNQGKFIEALTVFKATTQLEPANAHHFYNLGNTQKILRDYTAARESFKTALKLKPDYSEAQTQLKLLEKALATGVVRVLENIPILSRMTLEQSVVLAGRIQVEDFKAGQIIFHMGEMGDKFYVIEAGEVEVLAPDMGRQPSGVINRLSPGDFFGEIALLRAIPRTATIRAITPTRLLAISREDFESVVEKYPSIAHTLAETSGLRLLRDRQIGRRIDLDRYYDPGYIAELTHQNEVTVVMGDIHGSTFLTHAIGPELMVAFLDEYLLRMSTIIVQAGGAMDKSLGDSVMGVFGNFPGRHQDSKVTSANSALLAALKMRQAYVILRDEWKRESQQFAKTGMGIGISTGKVKTGTVGPEATMVGPAVNLSSKLSKLAINGRTESEIYVDIRTRELIGSAFTTEPLDMAYTRKKVGVDLEAYRVIQSR